MEFRNFFKNIFNTDKSRILGVSMEMLNSYNAVFTSFDDRIYDNEIVRGCIDAIARNGAKLNPKRFRRDGQSGGVNYLNDRLQRLLATRPNEYMSSYDFYYKVISQLYLNNNAFIYIEKDAVGNQINLFPLNYSQIEIRENGDDTYVLFSFRTGRRYTTSYKNIIHLRRHFNEHDFFGSNNAPLKSMLEYRLTIKEGLVNAIKTTANLRGIIKTAKTLLKAEDISKVRNQFVKDFTESDSGIGGLDASMDFKEVNLKPVTADAEVVAASRKEILDYFGINEDIINSSYDSTKWNAFYESILEPIAIQMAQEFTYKLFTTTELDYGNGIIFESNRLQYASIAEKAAYIKSMINCITIDEAREVWNLAPLPDGQGNKILQSLNFVNSLLADQYQTGGEGA